MAQIAFKGNPINTKGDLPLVGAFAPDFTLVNGKLESKSLSDYKGQWVVLNIFPSVDTGVCAQSVRQFNQKASELDNVTVLNISKDLPFAGSRFCAAEGLENVETLSDFRDSDFANKYGVTMTNGPLEGLFSRVVMILNPEGEIFYTEQVPEITQEPNYENALETLKQ